MICVTIARGSPAEVREALAALEGKVAMAELRLDLLTDPDPEPLLAGRPLPVLVTCRAAEEGGGWKGDHPSRLALLQRAIDRGAEWVDVEWGYEDRLVRRPGTRLLVSRHDFRGVPPDLPGLAREMAKSGADAVKIAVTANRLADSLAVFDLLAGAKTPIVALAMGPKGIPTRILGPSRGSLWTYAARTPSEAAAPGQLDWRTLAEVYGLPLDRPPEELAALAGSPALTSLGPAVHNAAFTSMGLPRLYLPLETDSMAEALAVAGPLGIRAFSVTIPLKEEAFRLADRLEPEARPIGAVNTLTLSGDGWVGANTDVLGIVGPLKRALGSLKGRSVLVLGAGGAARAAAHVATWSGARVTISSRNRERGEALAREVPLGAAVLDWEARLSLAPGEFAAIVNATPLGMAPWLAGETPIPADRLPRGALVFETVYRPLRTRLVREAEGAGLSVVTGDEMFLAQAAGQLCRWTGRDAALGVLRGAFDRERARRLASFERHVVLFGFRGSGKSTVGALLASWLGRPFLDTDRRIEEEAGRSTAEIFALEGEGGFREREALAVREAAGSRPSAVIALGGGAVLYPENVRVLRERGTLIWLDTPLDVLRGRLAADPATASTRPALLGTDAITELEGLFAAREPAYRALGAIRVPAGPPPEAVARRVADEIELLQIQNEGEVQDDERRQVAD
ncbi:MAG: type I 3-dehydroquinate dehydratase [Planctomycetes bacterium]|nr:type I 3-dehydroquinate dehydratase [Planctomycetota bacterium]